MGDGNPVILLSPRSDESIFFKLEVPRDCAILCAAAGFSQITSVYGLCMAMMSRTQTSRYIVILSNQVYEPVKAWMIN